MEHQHGPGCNHDHGHDHGHSHGPGPGQQQQMVIQQDPAMQELLDSLPTRIVPFAIAEATMPGSQPPMTQSMVVCPEHKDLECHQCEVNFKPLNYMQQFMKNAPPDAVPPPPNVQPPPQRAEAIKSVKEAGNNAFKAGNIGGAVQNYSKSADMALSRPPWEVAAIARDEVVIALCNRSAAFGAAGAWINALADADTVVALKRPWTKGHFRRARALVGLGRLEDARDAIIDGLQFEPDEKDLNAYLLEVDEYIRRSDLGLPLEEPSNEEEAAAIAGAAVPSAARPATDADKASPAPETAAAPKQTETVPEVQATA